MRYSEITEALDIVEISDVDIKKDGLAWTLRVDVGNHQYVYMIRGSTREAVFLFASIDQNGQTHLSLTGGGNAFQVMSYAVSFAVKYLNEMKPNVLNFSASPQESGRVALYDRIVKRMSNQIQGYTVEKSSGDFIEWSIVRD